MANTPCVLIVGAGPTGLTAAVELARRGFTPRIIDRDERPALLSKAVGISSHSLDILEPSGVTERLLLTGFCNLAFGIVGHVHWLQRPMLERVAGLKQ